MGDIPLNSDGGLEPHLTVCPKCGGDADELTLGVLVKAKLSNGQWAYANRGKQGRVRRQVEEAGLTVDTNWMNVPEREKVPASEPCKACYDKDKAMAEIVADGGVYIQCKACGLTGAINKESELAIDVRKNSGISAPDPVGYEHEGCETSFKFPSCPMDTKK